MKRHILIAALILSPALAFAVTADWEVDPSHSSASFTPKDMIVSNLRGECLKVTGKVSIDDKNLTKSTVEATIDATTIDTNEPNRDGHLKNPDFFDVEKFPTITFKSTK